MMTDMNRYLKKPDTGGSEKQNGVCRRSQTSWKNYFVIGFSSTKTSLP